MEQNWYAVYTKPQRELKVSKLLAGKGIESFCPINHTHASKTASKKVVIEPLFNSIIFINITDSQISTIQKIAGIQLIYWMSEPAKINNDEIDMIRNITANFINITLEKTTVKVGTSLSVIDAINVGLGDKSISYSYKNIKVNLPSLGYIISAERSSEAIEIITPQVYKSPSAFSLFPRRFNSLFTN
jgi:transcription antitermination factor NusG